ncbi:hypothetical protein HA152_07430 [Prochlorococcus marinus XMU1412]|uniref:SxtJ family membrane protein n=1 Tax=Prochlorococcus marinus TaxID=1219 RepID=UPI001ADB90FE|nr:SxtJ family membrane protein [Prochlorococcus marinus]MBO8240533.1 hypothetical protein [Prochlorococcus marinus XMU1412]MBW3071768.1 hypothetical protein [Prochlorococcus marinus str. MU1412]
MKEKISKKTLRDFGLLVSFGFPLFIGFLFPLITGHNFRIWTLWITILSFTLGLFSPKLLYFPYKIWMKLGFILGWINSRIILGLVFFSVLLPISLIMKVFKYDPLKIKKISSKTYKDSRINHKIDIKRVF